MASGTDKEGASGTDKEGWMRPVAKDGSSSVWKYFELELPDKKRARCIKCPCRYFKYSGSTTGMWHHLDKEHSIKKKSQSQIESATAPTSESAASAASSPSTSSGVSKSVNSSTGATNERPEAQIQMSIADSFARANSRKEPRDKIYARMAAKDRISFRTLAESYDVQQRIRKEGHEPYLHHNSVAREI